MPATIVLTGRLARNPESRNTNNGKTVTEITIPADSGYGDNKTTTWWKVVLFGKRAETAAQYLTKGRWVTVTGEPMVETYDKRDGSKGFSPKVKATDWAFVGPREDSQGAAPSTPHIPTRRVVDYSDADVPF